MITDADLQGARAAFYRHNLRAVNGVLYRAGNLLGEAEADAYARRCGFLYAEQLVVALSGYMAMRPVHTPACCASCAHYTPSPFDWDKYGRCPELAQHIMPAWSMATPDAPEIGAYRVLPTFRCVLFVRNPERT